MRILQLTPGTGNFHCGHCLRDNALALALRARGHEVTMVPLYLPSVTDESEASAGVPIFFGGINVYLQEKLNLLRRAPRWFDRMLNSPALLRWTADFAGMTSARDLGALTVSMLRGEEGHQAKELDRLLLWIASQPKPDVVCLSTALLAGLARKLKAQLAVPIVSTLQGEDTFLDSLPPPYCQEAWQLLATRAAELDSLIAVSHYFGDVMRKRLETSGDRIEVVHNGITLDGFGPAPSPPTPPAIGFLARMCPSKGLETLVEAFIELKRRDRVKDLKLRVAGAKTPADEPFVRALQSKLASQNLRFHAEWLPNVDRLQKQEFLRSLSVLSVPATYGEAFGLYVLEALATAVPVVQPRDAAFPELIEITGGGVLCEPNDAIALADALEGLLLDPTRASLLGQRGREAVHAHFSVQRMAEIVERVLNKVISPSRTAPLIVR